MINENVKNQESCECKYEDVISSMSQFPNSTIKKFYIKKLNEALYISYNLCSEALDDIRNIPELSAEKESLEFILSQVKTVDENSETLNFAPALCLLKVTLTSILEKESPAKPASLNEKIYQALENITPWINVEENIKNIDKNKTHSLYKFIGDESVKDKTLEEIEELYNEMF